jgi:hypothetical protein
MKKLFAAIAGATLLLGQPAFAASEPAPPQTPDKMVKAHLDGKGIKYEIDKDGDFKVLYKVGGGRTQIAWVRSRVNVYGNLKVREIWSPGYKSDGDDYPALIANTLLDKNHGVKLGAWEAQGVMAMFVVKIPADASADQLLDAIEATVNSADEVE